MWTCVSLCFCGNPLGQLGFGGVTGRFAGPAARIRDHLARGIVDRNGDAFGHHAFEAVADAEGLDGLRCQAALRQVGMVALQLIPAKLERLVGCGLFLWRGGRLRLGLRRGCGMGSPGSVWSPRRLPVGRWRHRCGIKTEPLDGLERRRVDRDVLHPGDEVEGVATSFALAETVPDVFGYADPELGRVAALVDRTRTAEAVSVSLEAVEEPVMLQHSLHGDSRFDGLEVNKR